MSIRDKLKRMMKGGPGSALQVTMGALHSQLPINLDLDWASWLKHPCTQNLYGLYQEMRLQVLEAAVRTKGEDRERACAQAEVYSERAREPENIKLMVETHQVILEEEKNE